MDELENPDELLENSGEVKKEFIDPVVTVPFFLWLAQAIGSAIVGFFTWELLAWWKKRRLTWIRKSAL